jgi:transcriptional regulator with GAF, ATPase, and Fis domain/tetratricopeptide (TPR) repeat protein
MNEGIPEFTPAQREFLAALEPCGEPVPLEAAKAMAPLRPGPLEDLIKRCDQLGWIARTDDNRIGLTSDLPETLRYDLKRINTPARLTARIDRIRSAALTECLSKRAMSKLLADAGRTGEAAEIEIDLAHEFVRRRDHEEAYRHLGRAVGMLHGCIMGGGDASDRVFVEAALELSSVSFAVGRGMQVLASYLRTAVNLAKASGNVRSHALACLHLGRLLAYLDRQAEALAMLVAGKEEVERLGDTDILKAAAEFLGLCFMMQGRFTEALIHFERAEEHFRQEGDRLLVYPMILWSLGITLFATGQIPRALGFFQGYWRSAREMGLPAVASIARSILGFSLAVLRKRREALFHLSASLEEAQEHRYAYSLFIARAGLAIQYFRDGDLSRSFDLLRSAVVEGHRATSALVFLNAHLLNLLAAFHERGLPPLTEGWEYAAQLDSCLRETGLPQRGVALRVRAEEKLRCGRPASEVMEDLTASLDCLERAGASFALNDTLLTMGRLKLREGARDEARSLVRRVWQQIRGMGLESEYVPEDLRFMLEEEAQWRTEKDSTRMLVDHYFDFLHALDAAADEEELFHRAVGRLSQILGAERGALFWGSANGGLELRAGHNFTQREMDSEAFQPSLGLVRQALERNQYIRTRPAPSRHPSPDEEIKGLLCLPIQVGSEVRGVLYYDNSYVSVNFDFLPPQWAPLLVRHTNSYIAHILELIRLREEASRLAADKSIQMERLASDPILAQSPVMVKALDQADKAARADATLLVTGETGTGKELLVRRIHRQSPRSAGPFVVLDAAAMPVSLVESELFGHEKGAFTGADARKRGRIELAHGGTLFVDEIGELPLPVQARLLRALEGKTFYRVGGTQPVKADFRLVAATNRNLWDEVAAGRFRQDLFYRLDVIRIVLPPLRDRGDDIILLARSFFRQCCHKYRRKGLELTRGHEEQLAAYPWPGNVRELKNVIERAVTLSGGNKLILDLPMGRASREAQPFTDTPTMDELQRRYITHVLEKTGGRIYGPNGAAEILGMKRSTLYTRMYKLGIRN